MMLNTDTYIKISKCNPRVDITVDWGCEEPQGQIALYMKRVGEPLEFAVYSPIQIKGAVLTFQFDELLFLKKQGRYVGRLVAGVTDYANIYFDYCQRAQILSVERS